ncbi:MAG: amidohydrolase [Spirochaetales bacterium]|nr:amidohydrolase [Spirochaetales bacterium]
MTKDPFISSRHELHRLAEASGKEMRTAGYLQKALSKLNPDRIMADIGGYGIAVLFNGKAPGPTILLRCDMDAVPVPEAIDRPYKSENRRISHQCGHDGHMAVMLAVAAELSENPPEAGQVILLFQPAEENGLGAASVLADPRFEFFKPDYAFALHNLPGFPIGQFILKRGTFSCASRGMTVRFRGAPTHAAHPEQGRSPAAAMCRFIGDVKGGTVVGSKLGEKAFGTAPGLSEVWVTLRSETDREMADIVKKAEELAFECARAEVLDVGFSYEDIFPAVENSHEAMDLLEKAVTGKSVSFLEEPFRWSEDFGRFGALCPSALFGIGAGENCPPLHDETYDFPDDIIVPASEIFLSLIEEVTGGAS